MSDEEGEEEELSNTERDDFIFESESDTPEIHSDYKVALDEMRKIIKFFRKSSVQTEILSSLGIYEPWCSVGGDLVYW